MLRSRNKVLEQQCKQVIRREMASYDQLSRPTRLKYEQSAKQAIDNGLFAERTFNCAHDVPLIEPCTKCERTLEDTIPYKQLMMSRIRELLGMLGGVQ
jgi:hypothetical protein